MVEFQWRVQYRDGTEVWQHDFEAGEEVERRYGDIKRDQVLFFDLFTMDKQVFVFRLHIDESSKRLIWRRRTQISQAMGEPVNGGDTEKTVRVFHLIGWQKTVRGENVQVLNLIDEEGRVFCTGEWNPNVAGFTAPQLYEFEKEKPKQPATPVT